MATSFDNTLTVCNQLRGGLTTEKQNRTEPSCAESRRKQVTSDAEIITWPNWHSALIKQVLGPAIIWMFCYLQCGSSSICTRRWDSTEFWHQTGLEKEWTAHYMDPVRTERPPWRSWTIQRMCTCCSRRSNQSLNTSIFSDRRTEPKLGYSPSWRTHECPFWPRDWTQCPTQVFFGNALHVHSDRLNQTGT